MKINGYPPGATPLDPDEIAGLRLAHITTLAELNRWEQDNIQDAQAWLARRRKTVPLLSEQFILQLHKQMYSRVWKWAGQYRRTDKIIGVSWAVVSQRVHTLLQEVQYWIDNKTYTPDEIAYRFHHQLVLIHLFPNGNGRHARLITDTLLVEVLNRAPFTWGRENLQVTNNVRRQYIAALKAADGHDYSLLAAFVRT